jgi:hypothetical protein
LSDFIPKTSFNVTYMVKVVFWFGNKIGHYGKTNLVKMKGTPNSQPYCEGIVVDEVVPFLNQGQVTICQQDNTLPCTEKQTKDILWQTISMYWNDPQGSLIYLQLSMCRTFFVNV